MVNRAAITLHLSFEEYSMSRDWKFQENIWLHWNAVVATALHDPISGAAKIVS